MITDEDLVPIDLADFWEEEEEEADATPSSRGIVTEAKFIMNLAPGTEADATPSSRGIVTDYVDRQIARIPVYGDDSRWRLASHLDMFENLSPDGTLTHAQRQAVDNFVLGYQYQKSSQPTSLEK